MVKMMPRYPQIILEFDLQSAFGNAHYIMGTCCKHMEELSIPQREQLKYVYEATRGDYNHLLRVTSEWFDATFYNGDESGTVYNPSEESGTSARLSRPQTADGCGLGFKYIKTNEQEDA